MIVALVSALATPLVTAGTARADTAPVPPVTVPTVSADALPTVQIDGVVWAQTVVGNKVYATGKFSQARPAGAAAGTNETPRSNILAYDITTGALDTAFAPSLNAQGLAIAASADGTRIFVGGDFTSVDGTARYRIVALDATTGAVVANFPAKADAQVRALTVSGNTLYAGGSFSTASGQARSRLAAFDATTGALLSWAPTVDQSVLALTAVPGKGQVVIGGRFTTLNGATALGSGAVDATTGANLPWAVNQVVKNYGADAGIYSLTTDGDQVYGTGYGYLVNNDPTTKANLENTFAAKATGGDLVWVSGCRGDTYGSAAVNGVLYNVGHAHDCSMIGGLPQTNPWTFQRAMAYNTAPAADGRLNNGGSFGGRPAPELLHWFPTLATGTFTGQTQAAWSVSGSSSYVVLGGEFPKVNGVAQQGLVRFAVTSVAPNKEGPLGYAELKPVLTPLAAGALRVSWQAGYDRDNARLTYEVLRGATLSTSTVIATKVQDSTWWSRPPMAFSDRTAPPGSTQTYRIRVKDALGNTNVSATTTATVPSGAAAASVYADAVSADNPVSYWRLGEGSGTAAYDWASGNDVTLSSDAQRGVTGALTGDGDAATGLTGAATVPGVANTAVPGPQTFSVEAWFQTTSTSGGKIVGFGNSKTGDSSSYDRHLYLTNTGKLTFGVYNGAVRTVTSSASYNDGKWHHVVGTLGQAGMVLYVDGKSIGALSGVTSAQAINGYWRIGGDNLNSWPNKPTSKALKGTVDEVAVYPAALTLDRVAAHYTAGVAPATVNQPPTASFTSSATNLSVAFDASGSSDPDGTVASYAWDFGDSGTDTGAKPTHVYAAAGTYTVKLTVTDDKGATNQTTSSVTVTAAPPANQPPTASFTSSATNLSVAFDASASSDPDGTVASYAWDFGDSGTDTGAKPTHVYAAAGTYSVKLTVTDDKGTTGTQTKSVTVVADQPVAQDAFARTVSSGFGTADVGGTWSVSGTGISSSVSGGAGIVSVPAGRTARLTLGAASATDAEMTHQVSVDAVPTGGGAYLASVVRATSTGAYQARVKITATGAVSLQMMKVVSGTETALGTAVTVSGLTYTAGTKLRVKVRATGSAPTLLQAKVWVDGSPEPATWTVSLSDSTAGLQQAGWVGFSPYLSGTATATITVRYGDLLVKRPA